MATIDVYNLKREKVGTLDLSAGVDVEIKIKS